MLGSMLTRSCLCLPLPANAEAAGDSGQCFFTEIGHGLSCGFGCGPDLDRRGGLFLIVVFSIQPLAVVAVAKTLAFAVALVVAATMAVDAVNASLAVTGLVAVVSAMSLAVGRFHGCGCGLLLWTREEHLLGWQLAICGN